MSLPHNGSTAPTITSPLLAWPSLPAARSPLSPSPSVTLNQGIPAIYSRRDTKGKGKAVVSDEGGDGSSESLPMGSPMQERRYGPPKQPLTPRQLSRIAQSFGIVVPTLPPPSPDPSFPDSPLAGPSRLRAETRPSPHLLTVVPPLSLLSLKSTSAEEAERRTRKWKRGRLIPLQSSLQGMLTAIAREYGLPSTKGLQLFMAAMPANGSSASSSSTADDTGPQISSQTWNTLFGAHLSASASRSSTPSSTPLKSAGPLGRDMAFPLSPLALVNKKLDQSGKRNFKLQDEPVSAPSRLPDTLALSPAPNANPVIATVEFDVDPDLATWYPEWRRNGRYRKSSTSSESGIRPLKLPRNLSNASPASARQFRSRTAELESDAFDVDGDTTLNDHDGDYSYSFSVDGEGVVGKPFPPLKSRESGRRLSVRGDGQDRRLVSTAGSFGEIDLASDAGSRRFSEDEGREDVPTVVLEEVAVKPCIGQVSEEDLLACPIELDTLGMLGPASRVVGPDGKRGSAMVMSEQLDDLERIMRQLSPRDIRLTSPRMLTPRMAAKVATSALQYPVKPASSSSSALSKGSGTILGNGSANSSSSSLSSIPDKAISGTPDKSTLTVNTFASESTVPSFDATTLSRPPLEAEYTEAGVPLPAWPAVSFAKLSGSPGSPSSVHDYFVRGPAYGAPAPSSPISNETLTRMKPSSDFEAGVGTTRPLVPRRPQRPPSPEFGTSPIPSHSLSPELVDHLRSPGGTPASPPNSASTDSVKRTKSRTGSISLKGLKHMGSRNFGWRRPDHVAPPALPLGSRDREQDTSEQESRPLGLFADKLSPGFQSSTFPGLHHNTPAQVPLATTTTEFGSIEPAPQPTAGASIKAKDGGAFARWNPFGSRKHSAPPAIPDSHSTRTADSAATSTSAKGKDKDRESKSSRRNPSVDRKDIGSPLSGSLKRMQGQAQHRASPSLSSNPHGLALSQSQSRPSLPGFPSSGTTRTLSSEAGADAAEDYPMDGRESKFGSPTQLPTSPRSVKRKPVPSPRKATDDEDGGDGVGVGVGLGMGIKQSLSIGSLAGFAVDDKRVGLGVRVE